MTPTIRTVAPEVNGAECATVHVTGSSPALRDAADTMALAGIIRAMLYTIAAIVAALGLLLVGMAARLWLPTWVLAAGFLAVVAVVLTALWVAWARHDEVTL
jgi:protein-S-isoprenylcysteine O-methyltransferase Ste14